MKVSSIPVVLSLLVALPAAVAATTGLLLQDDGAPFSFATLRGIPAGVFGGH